MTPTEGAIREIETELGDGVGIVSLALSQVLRPRAAARVSGPIALRH